MNIYDIAKHAGVSIATVSRVLNNNVHVSETTREKVLAVMNESRYVPNAFARGLGLNSMKTVGLVCPDAGDPYLSEAINCLESDFREHGYNCLLICTGHDQEGRREGVQKVLDRHVDSMVLMGSSFIEERPDDNLYLKEAGKRVPVFVLNGSYQAKGVYGVVCNDRKAMEEATGYLLKNGRKRILFLYHSMNNSGTRKLNGYKDALKKAGIGFNDELCVHAERNEKCFENVHEALARLDQQGVTYDAILTTEDILAVGVLKYASGTGKRIPDELMVIGCNNSLLSRCTEPELSTIDNKVNLLCKCIVENLINVMEGEERPSLTSFDADLVLRRTTGEQPK